MVFYAARQLSELVKPQFRKSCGVWLLGCGGLVGGMITLGGYTRLKRAGLSITEWSLTGEKLPLSNLQWEQAFGRYKETPEYRVFHYSMELEDFKLIFLLEWIHRFAGRSVGLVFGSGFLYFLCRRALYAPMICRLLGLFCLGGAQGVIGWWMVKSGLEEKEVPRVSAVRLVTHLSMALGLYTALVWNGCNLLRNSISSDQFLNSKLCRINKVSKLVFSIVATTVLSGGLVAGNDAGHTYNTWPKMLDRWTPEEFSKVSKENWLKMFVQDSGVVQFNHRLLAYISLVSTTALFLYTKRLNVPMELQTAAHFLPAFTGIQVLLGILTLIWNVPPYMGVLHQSGGILTLTAVLNLAHLSKVRV